MSIASPILTRANVSLGGLTKGITGAITSITNPIQELFGVKGELYTIGYIAADWQDASPLLKNGLLGGLIKTWHNVARSVSQFFSDVPMGGQTQDGITIDGFFNFASEMSVSIPENPLMYDTPIADHRIRTPDAVSMDVFINAYASDDVLEEASRLITDNDLVSLLTGTSGNTARVRRKLNEFRWLQNQGRPFTLYTPHGVFENMLLQKITAKNDHETMDGWAGTLVFREVVYYTDAFDGTQKSTKKALSSTADSFYNSLKSIII